MNIMIVSQYFWPESFIINDLALHLNHQGHDVTVLTGKPNYPDGKIFKGYTAKGVQHEIYQGLIDVFRVPLRPRNSASFRELLLNYLSFVWSGLRCFPRLIKDKEIEAILVFAPSPITAAIPAIPLKWAKNAHLAIWVQDLWPESLSATGHIKNPLLLKSVGWLVKGIYFFADTLLIQSRAFYEPVSQLVNPDKIKYYPNSIDSSTEVTEKHASLPDTLVDLLQKNFCLVFAGNLGKAQAVETLVEVAKYLKGKISVKIVLVGSGSMIEWLTEQKQQYDLDNLILAGRFPVSLMPIIYKHAAGLLVTLRDEQIFSYTIPSKIQSYMSCGRPIIASINGEAARIIDEAGAGLTCPAQDVDALLVTISQFYNMSPLERDKLGQKGRKYFMENFEMKQQSKRLVEILEQRIKQEKVGEK